MMSSWEELWIINFSEGDRRMFFESIPLNALSEEIFIIVLLPLAGSLQELKVEDITSMEH